ncbi:putative rotein [Toxocara canis]|uniref:Putative rotein n=1 Tax=Toxocara canis TaxID=6265 RepID=A0A0B2VR45_TOXCA|nr:putative rotein [Toxocara canis]
MSMGLRLGTLVMMRLECSLVRPACPLSYDLLSHRSLFCCSSQPSSPLVYSRLSLLAPAVLHSQQVSLLGLSSRNQRMWRITMDDETKRRKRDEIEKMKKEKQPVGLFAKVKYYVKRYWYIAVPVHFIGSLVWFGALYAAVKSGIDIISLLEHLHLPESLIDKAKNTPPGASVLVLTLILYKVASPLRYATTLAGIQVVFLTLKRIGKLPIAKEVEYEIRSKYESEMQRIGRRYHKHSKSGVRAVKRRPDEKPKAD